MVKKKKSMQFSVFRYGQLERRGGFCTWHQKSTESYAFGKPFFFSNNVANQTTSSNSKKKAALIHKWNSVLCTATQKYTANRQFGASSETGPSTSFASAFVELPSWNICLFRWEYFGFNSSYFCLWCVAIPDVVFMFPWLCFMQSCQVEASGICR